MNAIERLEKLGEQASERPWENDDVHSARTIDARFIVAAVNALPDLLTLARAARALTDLACEQAPQGPCGECDFCRLRGALEPLFREDGSDG